MTSPLVARPRRARVVALASALLASVAAPLLSTAPASADHAGAEPGPVHAGNTYGWWDKGIAWREEFETPYSGPTGPQWQASGQGQVVHQNGMLTLNTTDQGSLSATLGFEGAEVGRWETRLRSRQYGRGGARFRVVTELVPAGGRDQHCGAQYIALESYRIGTSRANLYARSLPERGLEGRDDGHGPGSRPLAHVRRRGHPRPHLLVRGRPRRADGASTGDLVRGAAGPAVHHGGQARAGR